MRSFEQIESLIKEALRPVRVEVELIDFDTKVAFRAFPENGDVVRLFEREPIEPLKSGSKLFQLLRAARGKLESLGISLEEWSQD